MFLNTPEGQALVWKTWRIDLHHYPESHMAKTLAALKQSGVEPKEVTIAWWQAHPEIAKAKREMVKILRQKRR